MSFTLAEENYIKTIYHLASQSLGQPVATTAIAEALQTKPASVSDMLKKLAKKKLIFYTKYKGVTLTQEGQKTALLLIRKHRLWEVFLVKTLNFAWDEVHEIAEQLEHIHSTLLIERVDEFLGYPKYDPHGDPIPDKYGNFAQLPQTPLSALKIKQNGKLISVKDTQTIFLQYLDKIGLKIGSHITVLDKILYDGSLQILVDGKEKVFVSREVAANLLLVLTKN
jgi:DtxR family transcriptional regulator, Mn-dependent transcriptional regulator